MNVFSTFKETLTPFVSETLGYSDKDYDIIKIYTEISSLYEEITFLISHQKKSGFFQQAHSLEEFKYDFSNECGVLFRVGSDETSQKNVIKTFGDVRILSEKNWI